MRFENACPKSGLSPPLQIGVPKTTFSTISQLNGNFNGLYLRSETWCRQSASALTTGRGLLYGLKTTWTLVHKRLQIRPLFLLTLRKFCVSLHCGLHTCTSDHIIMMSIILCQMDGGKWRWCEVNKVLRTVNVNETVEIRSQWHRDGGL